MTSTICNTILDLLSLSTYPLVTQFERVHTTYSKNDMGQKCEGNCGFWVLNEIIKKMFPENLKKIVGAVWKLPAK